MADHQHHAAAVDAAQLRALPLCGHWECADSPPRTSVLDEPGDVVLYRDCDGTGHLFRDGRDDGLILNRSGGGWALTRERYTHTADQDGDTWQLIPHAEPVCDGGWDPQRREFVARHRPTGWVIARHDTQYGLMARAARFYLRTTDPAEDITHADERSDVDTGTTTASDEADRTRPVTEDTTTTDGGDPADLHREAADRQDERTGEAEHIDTDTSEHANDDADGW